MRLYAEPEAPPIDARLTCREAAWPAVVMTLLIGGGGLFWCVVAYAVEAPASIPITALLLRGFLYFVGGLCLLLTVLFLVPHTVSLFGSANWLMRLGPDGLLIKFRAPGNAHFPAEDPVVVFIPMREIASVCRTVVRKTVPDSEGGSMAAKTTSLDIHLKHKETDDLEAALARERALPAMGGKVSKSKVHSYPLSVPSPGVVRVAWRGPQTRVTPGLRRVLRHLERGVRIGVDTTLDGGDWEKLSDGDLEDYLLGLVESGDIITATKVARLRYGWSLTEAKRFVDELGSGGSTASEE